MKLLLCCALALFVSQAIHAATYTLHTVHSGSVPSRVRIVNLSDAYGVVEIVGFDDQGEEYGPVELEIEANASVVLLTRELENGAPDKGLLDGLGDGSGQWQLQLTTELEIGAVSFKGGVLSDVLSEAEASSSDDELSPSFLWAHRVADRDPGIRISPGPLQKHGGYGNGIHELLSAYDWEPHQEVGGIELGWGTHKLSYTYSLWLEYGSISNLKVLTRYGGRLDYAAFAVQHGMINGQPLGNAYVIGTRLGCYPSPLGTEGYWIGLPPEGTQWSGAAVMVTPTGQFGHGKVDFTLGQTIVHEYENDLDKLYVTLVHVEGSIVDAKTGDPLQEMNFHAVFRKFDSYEQVPTFGEIVLYGHSCSELAGWREMDGYYSAFGARLVEADDIDEE